MTRPELGPAGRAGQAARLWTGVVLFVGETRFKNNQIVVIDSPYIYIYVYLNKMIYV